MTRNAELVPVRVAKVRAEVVVVVLRAKTWRTFAGATVLQGGLVCRPDYHPGGRSEGNHLPIPRVVWLSVEGLADDEERARATCAVPPCPRPVSLAEARLDAEAIHQCAVEAQRALEIADAYKDVGKHVGSSGNLEGSSDCPMLAAL